MSTLLREPGAHAFLTVRGGLFHAYLPGKILRGVLGQDVGHGGQAVIHGGGALHEPAELFRVGLAYLHELPVVVKARLDHGLQLLREQFGVGREAHRGHAPLLAQAPPYELPGPVGVLALRGDGIAQLNVEHAAVRLAVRHAGKGVFPAVVPADDAQTHVALQRLELQQADVVLADVGGEIRARFAALAQQADILLAVEGAGPGLEVRELHGGEFFHPAPERLPRHPEREKGQVRLVRRGLGLGKGDARLGYDVLGRGEGDQAEGIRQRAELALRAHGLKQAGEYARARVLPVGVEIGQQVHRRRGAQAHEVVIVAKGEDVRPVPGDELGVQQFHAHALVIEALDADLVVRVLAVEGVHEVVHLRAGVVREQHQLGFRRGQLLGQALERRIAGLIEDIAAVRLLPDAQAAHYGDTGLGPVEELGRLALPQRGDDIAPAEAAAQQQAALRREAQGLDAQLAGVYTREAHGLGVQLAEAAAAVHAVAHGDVDAPVHLQHGGEAAPLFRAVAGARGLAVRAELGYAHVVQDIKLPVLHRQGQVAVEHGGVVGVELRARVPAAAEAEDAHAGLGRGQGGDGLAVPAHGLDAHDVLGQSERGKAAVRAEGTEHGRGGGVPAGEDQALPGRIHG